MVEYTVLYGKKHGMKRREKLTFIKNYWKGYENKLIPKWRKRGYYDFIIRKVSVKKKR